MYKENQIKSNWHFYKHISAGSVYIQQFNTFRDDSKSEIIRKIYQMHQLLSLNPSTRDRLVRSRHLRKSNPSTFKDLQTLIKGFLRITSVFKDFPGLQYLKKIQRLSKTHKSPDPSL